MRTAFGSWRPRPCPHNVIASRVSRSLFATIPDDRGVYQVLGIQLPAVEQLYMPDLVVMSEHVLPDPSWTPCPADEAELVVEIVSRSSRDTDRRKKLWGYAHAPVPLYLLIDAWDEGGRRSPSTSSPATAATTTPRPWTSARRFGCRSPSTSIWTRPGSPAPTSGLPDPGADAAAARGRTPAGFRLRPAVLPRARTASSAAQKASRPSASGTPEHAGGSGPRPLSPRRARPATGRRRSRRGPATRRGCPAR
ncbi:Uma2 family endonuclease [Nocardiopsis dassonvillei]|uniref:Uma2 family endonuclease n=1 Tax=Nocardiopsis dassonvillei TaxID=2014 RepID=UPI000F704FA4|nr:Uma2 family endonuclease [Nocardiopsis dassonvillei]VEI90102.1 Uncharacterized protein conserved in cyanobacteria [Nocardiopsis dassonvillei]